MNNKIIVTFDKSDEDVPVLCVARETMSILSLSPGIDISKVITGKEAEELWKKLTCKEDDFLTKHLGEPIKAEGEKDEAER